MKSKIWTICGLSLLASCGQNKKSADAVRSEQVSELSAPISTVTAPVSETLSPLSDPAPETAEVVPLAAPADLIQGKFGNWSAFPAKDGVASLMIRGERIFVLLGLRTKELAKHDKVVVQAEMLRGSFKIEGGNMLISDIQYSCDGVSDQSNAVRSIEEAYSFVKGATPDADQLTVGTYKVSRNELDLSKADYKLQIGCTKMEKGSSVFVEAKDFLEGAF